MIRSILCLNVGSSSLKVSGFAHTQPLARTFHGAIDRIGSVAPSLKFGDLVQGEKSEQPCQAKDAVQALDAVIRMLTDHKLIAPIELVVHRVVHGMGRSSPERVTPQLLESLREARQIDPEHMPGEIAVIESMSRRFPKLGQMVCFDTAFHERMPRLAKLLPIPLRYFDQGVRRYGFHGLSFEYLMRELHRLGDPAAEGGRVILAHLGSGASLAAVRDSLPVDTTMGMSPSGGLMMGTRTGDLDPGVAAYLARRESTSSEEFFKMASEASGLLGVSETSSDLRDLLKSEPCDSRASDAVNLFCYQVKKWIGSFAAALGGVDTLVFSGGIGENSPAARARICQGLEFLGIDLDVSMNAHGNPVISRQGTSATVRVIKTDEELMMARLVTMASSGQMAPK